MQATTIKKIVIIGPESTGKTTLCQQLAGHFHTEWCPEYAREYLLKHGMDYSYDDLLTIARGQLALEDKGLSDVASRQPSPGFYFIDTNMYVMKVWCEFVFGKCHPFILQEIEKRKYDLYLLCNVDLPWVKDELREYPDLETREKLYHIYKNILIGQSIPWIDISGNSTERLQKAVDAVNRYFK